MSWLTEKGFIPYGRPEIRYEEAEPGIYEVAPPDSNFPHKRVVAYIRTGSGLVESREAALQGQVDAAVTSARDAGETITHLAIDIGSALAEARPGWAAVMDMARSNRLSHVFVYSHDRLTRVGSLADILHDLQSHNVQLTYTEDKHLRAGKIASAVTGPDQGD